MEEIRTMNTTWNAHVSIDIDRINYSFEEFLKKMEDTEYINKAIEKMNSQNRISICQYKKDTKKSGFTNLFLIKQSEKYYFVYKSKLDYSNKDNFQFLPAVSEYKIKDFDINSLDYLANFAVCVKDNDYIYSVDNKKLMTYKEFIN